MAFINFCLSASSHGLRPPRPSIKLRGLFGIRGVKNNSANLDVLIGNWVGAVAGYIGAPVQAQRGSLGCRSVPARRPRRVLETAEATALRPRAYGFLWTTRVWVDVFIPAYSARAG